MLSYFVAGQVAEWLGACWTGACFFNTTRMLPHCWETSENAEWSYAERVLLCTYMHFRQQLHPNAEMLEEHVGKCAQYNVALDVRHGACGTKQVIGYIET